ncbi:Uma2 family endonuclease [Actinoallomurus iriomotensis]
MVVMTSLPEWLYPGPENGWTADDLDALPPDAPRRVELIDGALVLMSPQTKFHMLVVNLLTDSQAGIRPPAGLAVVREMAVKLGLRQRPEPDVMVVKDDALDDLDRTYYLPEDVRLVVEVVSPDSEDRDRFTKPIKYAEAGIRFLWRVERDGRRPVVYTYELDPSIRAYVPTGVHHGRLRTDIGFDVDLSLDLGRL